jgi:menaquinone-dependent protoporphyrinogen oxidase
MEGSKRSAMAKLLLVYGTVDGQTRKIALAIADELRKLGHEVEATDARSAPSPLGYQGVVVGAPVHYSGFPAVLRHWVKDHSIELSRKASAFYSVCLGVLQKDDPQAQENERKIVRDFLDWSGWTPQAWTLFAGALLYTRYGWLKRAVMRLVAGWAGGDTDTSRDFEYTDWEDVRKFAREFSSRVEIEPIRRVS